MPSQTPIVSKLVQAGAGTGKTESLAREVIQVAKKLYSQNNKVPQIVATTFTEQATTELRQRVVQLTQKELDADWLSEFVRNPEALQISTIHGVFAKILHRHGPLIGIDPEFSVMSAEDERQVVRKKLRLLMATSEEANQVIDQYGFENAVVILMQVMTQIHTYGKNAKALLNWEVIVEKDKKQLFGYLQSVASASIKDLPAGLTQTLEILVRLFQSIQRLEGDYEKLRNTVLDALSGVRQPSIKNKGIELKEDIQGIFDIKKKWSDESYDPAVNAKHEVMSKTISNVATELLTSVLNYKYSLGVLSFSDLELLTLDLLRLKPEVQMQVQQLYDYWFVDEFQDTSPLQKTILYMLFRKPWNVYFVGDPQQSIYLFRGADKNVFEQTKQNVLEQKGDLTDLKVNYRSSGDLIKFFNLIFSPLTPKEPAQGKASVQISFHHDNVDQQFVVAQAVLEFLQQGFSYEDIGILTRTNKEANILAHFLTTQKLPVYVHTTGGFYERREVVDALCLLDFILDPYQDDVFVTLARSPWLHVSDQQIAEWGQELRKMSSTTRPPLWKHIEHAQHENLFLLKEFLEIKKTMPLSFVFEHALTKLGFFEFSSIGDASGKREANLRKVLADLRAAETQKGFNATQFVQKAWLDADKLGEEKEAVSFIEPQKINIMTIHKSKGLKFECVVLTEAGRGPRQSHKQLELSPDGSWAIQVLSDKSEEKISPLPLVYLKEQRLEHEAAEFMRLFYVATTRAASRLNIVSLKEFHPQSWLGQLQGKLNYTLGVHENCYQVKIWEENPDLNETATQQKVQESMHQEAVKKIKTVFELPLPSVQFINKNVDYKKIVDDQNFGTQLHAVFEHIKNNPQKALADIIKLSGKKIKLGDVVKTLEIKEVPLLKIMENGFSEWPFSFKHNGKVFSGRIDLWGIVDDKVWIIDYKSGQDDMAVQQLEFYAVALFKKGLDWSKMSAAVVRPLTQTHKIAKLRDINLVLENLSLDYRDHQLDQI